MLCRGVVQMRTLNLLRTLPAATPEIAPSILVVHRLSGTTPTSPNNTSVSSIAHQTGHETSGGIQMGLSEL
jgi:hypothetical protein